MTTIQKINAREVLDSRGRPTVEVEVTSSNGAVGRAIVPSGASTGTAEALELRDGDRLRYDGQGVRRAVANVQQALAPHIIGLDATDQCSIDRQLLQLDSSPQKSTLGGNSLLGVSLASAHCGAAVRQLPLYQHLHSVFVRTAAEVPLAPTPGPPRMPLPMTNMISGGLHAGGNLDFQDVLVMPIGAGDYAEGLEWIVRVYRRLGDLLRNAGYEGRLVGDEGGFGPRLRSNREAAAVVVQAIEAAGLRAGHDMTLAVDVAATHFYHDGMYQLASDANASLSAEKMIDMLETWITEFPVTSIEDGLSEDDWAGWRKLTERLGRRVQLVGDDLFTTNPLRVQQGIDQRVANSVLVKVNQIGTVCEAMTTIHIARTAGYSIVVSARSGETEDTTIADLAVAVAAEQIKIGSIVRSERLAKYNQLLRIGEILLQEGREGR